MRIPSLALERVRLELGHMADLVAKMLENVPAAFRIRDFRKVSQYHDQVVVLREAVLEYRQHLGRENLTDAESDEHAQPVYTAGEIESISSAVGRELASLGEVFRDESITASEATGALLEQLDKKRREAARAGLRAIVENDERSAREVVACRNEFWKLGNELLQQQAAPLAQDDPQRLLKHRLQVDLLDRLRRLYSYALTRTVLQETEGHLLPPPHFGISRPACSGRP
jgi:phosphate:Na+ symporter